MFQDANERALMCRLIPPMARESYGSTAHLAAMPDTRPTLFYICSVVNISGKLASAVRHPTAETQKWV